MAITSDLKASHPPLQITIQPWPTLAPSLPLQHVSHAASHLDLNSGWNCAATKNGCAGGLSESSRISMRSPVSSLPTNSMPLASSSGTSPGLTSYLQRYNGVSIQYNYEARKCSYKLFRRVQ